MRKFGFHATRSFTISLPTGVPEFDDRMIVGGNGPSQIIAYLTVRRRDALLRLPELGGKVEDNKVCLSRSGARYEPDEIDTVTSTLVEVAVELDSD